MFEAWGLTTTTRDGGGNQKELTYCSYRLDLYILPTPISNVQAMTI